MKALSKSDILGADDLRTEVVEVPEWGGEVTVRSLTGAAREALESSMVHVVDGKRTTDLSNLRTKFVAASIIDANGDLMFSQSEVDALSLKDDVALRRVYDVAERLNAIGAAAVDTALKNSEAAPSGASITDSL